MLVLLPMVLIQDQRNQMHLAVLMCSSDAEDEIPLSWQTSNRAIREQLVKDGYNLDLESDNEDLDLIPPKQNYGTGGICSCSSDTCLIS